MKVYELADTYNALTSLLEEEGATEEALQGQLRVIQEAFNAKAENIGKLILSLDGEATAITDELTRLNARKQATERKAEWLKSYLLQEMVNARIEKIKGTLVSLAIRNNPPSVSVLDINLVPMAFRRIIPERFEADKKLILDHVKSTGEVVPGCEIVTDKKSLSVK